MTAHGDRHPATVGPVDERQRYALEHPLNEATEDVNALAALTALRVDTPLPGGNLLRSVLAVDR